MGLSGHVFCTSCKAGCSFLSDGVTRAHEAGNGGLVLRADFDAGVGGCLGGWVTQGGYHGVSRFNRRVESVGRVAGWPADCSVLGYESDGATGIMRSFHPYARRTAVRRRPAGPARADPALWSSRHTAPPPGLAPASAAGPRTPHAESSAPLLPSPCLHPRTHPSYPPIPIRTSTS